MDHQRDTSFHEQYVIENRGEEPRKESPTVHLFDMKPKQEQRLRDRIDRSKGFVTVLVHPYYFSQVEQGYAEPISREQSPTGYRRRKRIDYTINKLVGLPASKTAPIIIFESLHEIGSLQKRIDKMKHHDKSNEIYLVDTKPDSPLPIGAVGGNQGDEWEMLVEKFKDLGVKKILLGGQRFVADPTMTHENKHRHHYCVGETHAQLRPYFEVTISPFTAPGRI